MVHTKARVFFNTCNLGFIEWKVWLGFYVIEHWLLRLGQSAVHQVRVSSRPLPWTTMHEGGGLGFTCINCKKHIYRRIWHLIIRCLSYVKYTKGLECWKYAQRGRRTTVESFTRLPRNVRRFISLAYCASHMHPWKKTATNAIEPLPLKHRNLTVKVAPKPPKSPSRSIPEQRVKYVVQCVKFEEHQGHDYEGHDGSKKFADASSEDGSEAQSPKEATDEDTPVVEPPISAELQYIILGTTSDERHSMW